MFFVVRLFRENIYLVEEQIYLMDTTCFRSLDTDTK
jgi:hypothetical protein